MVTTDSPVARFDNASASPLDVSAYMPAFKLVQEALQLDLLDLQPGGVVSVGAGFFKHLMACAISQSFFDERWYLETYPDVEAAIHQGAVSNARDHYLYAGYYEGRSPGPCFVDRQWYEEFYPDVAAAIVDGTITDSAEHFYHNGYFEGRVARAEQLPVLQKWMGALHGA